MKLSIIVPVYNGQEHIEKCLNSISNQSFKDFEIIVINDGSIDQTDQIINDYFNKHSNINHQIINQTNKGLTISRKIGIDHARGEFIGFVDSDDDIEIDYYEKMIQANLNDEYDVVCSGFINYYQNHKTIYDNKLDVKDFKLSLLKRDTYYQYVWNKIYRKSILKQISFINDKFIGEDFIFSMKVLDLKPKIKVINNIGYNYRQTKASQTRQPYNELYQNMYHIFNDYYLNHLNENPIILKALERYLVLHYMYILVSMTRNDNYDHELEAKIISFIKKHKDNYLKESKDNLKAKIALQMILSNYSLFKVIAKAIDK